MLSADKQLYIEKSVAYHLRQLKRVSFNGELEANCVQNADETHLMFIMKTCKMLELIGNNQVKYADVVLGDKSVTTSVFPEVSADVQNF